MGSSCSFLFREHEEKMKFYSFTRLTIVKDRANGQFEFVFLDNLTFLCYCG